uniref:BTB domain-containing protein n=1 Tax=Corethron hystrix TaxID=216773 RepID=A0A7S1BSA7_9STRA|mmetsp:Transcript_37510/g.87472  ORF Transcript_37510/g.87472 Transcript_37510/m.87472 type:complete len:480 (+) Transcript_37510:119-1558(+)
MPPYASEETIDPTDKLVSRIKSILIDRDVLDYIFDLQLQTCDGKIVRASKILLAARSTVFRDMFLHTSSKELQTTIRVIYRSTAVQCLVDFCCSGEVKLPTPANGPKSSSTVIEDYTRILVHLIAMAKKYQIYELHSAGVFRIFSLVSHARYLLCAALDESLNVHEPFADMILNIIALNPHMALLPIDERRGGGVLSLNARALEIVSSRPDLCCNEGEVFDIIRYWAAHDMDSERTFVRKPIIAGTKSGMEMLMKSMDFTSVRFKEAAVICSKALRLYRIPPKILLKFGIPERLVTRNELATALLKQKNYDGLLSNIFASTRSLTNGVVDSIVVIGSGTDGANGIYKRDGNRYEGRTHVLNGRLHRFFIQKTKSFVRLLNRDYLCPCLTSRCVSKNGSFTWLLYATAEPKRSDRPERYMLLYESKDDGSQKEGGRFIPMIDFHCSSHSDFIEFAGKPPCGRQFLFMKTESQKADKPFKW